jgi:PAS domain S-box-containing protein
VTSSDSSAPASSSELAPAWQEQFAFLADLIPQLVWITDPTGFHTYFNQRWTTFTGYTLADSVGPDMWNNLLHPDDRQRARQVWGHSLATGEDYNIEYRFKSKDGSYRWFLGQALPRRDASGQIVAWFGTCTDIEEQRRLREQLEAAYSDLEAKVVFRTLELEHELQVLRKK